MEMTTSSPSSSSSSSFSSLVDVYSSTVPYFTPPFVSRVMLISASVWLVLLVIGSVGNVLTMCVLLCGRIPHSSTSIYLTVLAVVDMLYLLCSLNANIIYQLVYFPEEEELRHMHVILCKALPLLSYTLSSISVWLLVSVTVDRCIWVLKPFRANALCTPGKAGLISILIVCIFTAVHSQYLFNNVLEESQHRDNTSQKWIINRTCKSSDFGIAVVPSLEVVVILIIPFVIMICANSLIIHRLRTLRHTRVRHLHKKPDTRDQQRNSSLTIMLLFTSILFMTFTGPMLLYNFAYLVVDWESRLEKDENLAQTLLLWEKVLYTLWYTKFSVHFYLYCMSGQRFREEAVHMLHLHRFACCAAPTRGGGAVPITTGQLQREERLEMLAVNRDYSSHPNCISCGGGGDANSRRPTLPPPLPQQQQSYRQEEHAVLLQTPVLCNEMPPENHCTKPTLP